MEIGDKVRMRYPQYSADGRYLKGTGVITAVLPPSQGDKRYEVTLVVGGTEHKVNCREGVLVIQNERRTDQ